MQPTALYQQVEDFIVRNIQDGSWPPGHRLPSEHELVQRFGMSRMTVNRALRELVQQGRIVRVAGVGSFVAQEKPQSTLLHIASIGREVRERGHAYRFAVRTAERAAAPPDVSTTLGLQAGDMAFHTVCLHLENEVPVQLEDRWVNPRVVPDFLERDLAAVPPGDWLVQTVPFDEIEHLVDAVLPCAEEARILQIEAAEPCLLLTRRTWTRTYAVTLVRCLHPSSRYRLGCRFDAVGSPRSG
jgi:GntR family histidine utilization transcriptional repressor